MGKTLYEKVFDLHTVRKLPSGQYQLFMGLQMLAALAILLQFNWFAVGVGAASLAVVFTYPLMKRVTWFVGGVAVGDRVLQMLVLGLDGVQVLGDLLVTKGKRARKHRAGAIGRR